MQDHEPEVSAAGGDSNPDQAELEALTYRPHPFARFLSWDEPYAVTRFVLLRMLGLVYFVAFLVTALQFKPLIGTDGLEPAGLFLHRVAAVLGSPAAGFEKLPSVFWFDCSNHAIAFVAWTGVLLSLAVLCGVTNAVVMLVLWAMYLSITQIGQVFYAYGWEMQLCETGLLAVFLCPMKTLGPFRAPRPPPIVIVLARWLVVRVMLGAGFIKLRGDPCWKDFTCLVYHWETQPIPNPVSWLLNAAPLWFQKLGVAFNFLAEVIAPWFAFGPRRARIVAGTIFISFQIVLIVSGNLSFLNWLTIVPAIACFDDRALLWPLSQSWREPIASRFGLDPDLKAKTLAPTSKPQRAFAWSYAVVVGFLSMNPIVNLLSERQAMNESFEPLHIVNTYGAFGSVNRRRYEVIIEGTRDRRITPQTHWQAYEFPCKPGDPKRRPCWISPYHERLDWQMWFAAFEPVRAEPWLVHMVYKLLTGDRELPTLLAKDPFENTPPRWIRAELYLYHFTRPGDGSRAWWRRELVGPYLPPLNEHSPSLVHFMIQHGWRVQE
jgi:Lipase maturation factor